LLRAMLDMDQRPAAGKAGVTLRWWRRWEAGYPFNTLSLLKISDGFANARRAREYPCLVGSRG
jgi:hypothetical protein